MKVHSILPVPISKTNTRKQPGLLAHAVPSHVVVHSYMRLKSTWNVSATCSTLHVALKEGYTSRGVGQGLRVCCATYWQVHVRGQHVHCRGHCKKAVHERQRSLGWVAVKRQAWGKRTRWTRKKRGPNAILMRPNRTLLELPMIMWCNRSL